MKATPKRAKKSKASAKAAPGTKQSPQTTLADLKQDLNLSYKIKVVLYDLRNIKTNPEAEKRTLQTTDELYISAPYFTAEEAGRVKGAIVMLPSPPASIEGHEEEEEVEQEEEEHEEERAEAREMSVEDAIKERLANFFEKRRASGDSRPCGPHDIAPIYEVVFGVEKSELEDERFLSRLRRSGLRGAGELAGKEKGKVR